MSITNGQWKKQDNSGRVGDIRWSRGIGKPYQNRIKTGPIFEDLLLSERSRKSDAVSEPYQNPIC